MLYTAVADQLASQIRNGIYAPGDRLPSVRHMSRQLRISPSTAVRAYQALQDRGLVQTRPQSGHFVRWPAPDTVPALLPATQPRAVSIAERLLELAEVEHRCVDFVQLGMTEPDATLLPVRRLNRIMIDELRREPDIGVRYDATLGLDALRTAIARHALSGGCIVAPEDVIITNGCHEALLFCLQAVAAPGAVIAVESPAYAGFLQTIEGLGMQAIEIPAEERSGMSVEALGLVLERWPVAACFAMPRLSNPLGSCMSDAKKQALVALLAERDIPLIEGDDYGDLVFGDAPGNTARSFDRSGRVLLCASFSKTLAPGYRIGWIVPGRYRQQIQRIRANGCTTAPALLQRTLARFLQDNHYERHLRQMRKHCAQGIARTQAAVHAYFPAGTEVSSPAGGVVLWIKLPAGRGLDLYRKALERGIGIAPGEMFSTQPNYERFIRINCAQPCTPRLDAALMTLGRLAAGLDG